jgi:hypothetical protein
MPMSAERVATINNLISGNPREALAIAGGLVAVSALKFKDILRAVGINDGDLSRSEAKELELFDEESPANFPHDAVQAVHDGLVGYEMRGRNILPTLLWRHGGWKITRRGIMPTEVGIDTSPTFIDRFDITTPKLDERSGKLV